MSIKPITTTQINLLGDRLRHGELTRDDLKLLDMYRRAFRTPYEAVIHIIRHRLQLEPTGRPAKSTSSIIEKLKREQSRLATIQDIAGCRVVIKDCIEQDDLLNALPAYFPKFKTIDRRINPSYGYRAVHFVAFVHEKPIEIQIRTALQHLWAELSERLSDIHRPIKYGGGPENIRKILDTLSARVKQYETVDTQLHAAVERAAPSEVDALMGLKMKLEEGKIEIENQLKYLIDVLK